MDENRVVELIKNCKIELEQKLPVIMQTKTGFHNFTTGKNASTTKELCENDEYCNLLRTSKEEYGSYFKYDPEAELLVVIICTISAHALKESDLNEIRHWKEFTRYYITKEKEIFYKRKYHYRNYEKAYVNNAAQLPIDYTTTININHSNKQKYYENRDIQKETLKIFPPIVNYGGDSTGEICNMYSLNNFLIYREPRCIPESKQKILKTLLKHKLKKITFKDIQQAVQPILKKETFGLNFLPQNDFKFVITEKPTDDILVIRNFSFSFIFKKPYILEMARIYCCKNKKPVAFRLNNFNEWISYPYNKLFNTGRYYNISEDIEIFKNTCFEKFIDIYQSFPEGYEFKIMANYIREPILEQLHKSGLEYISKDIAKENPGNVEKLLHCSYFYEYNFRSKNKNILEKIGVNRFQIEHYNQELHKIIENQKSISRNQMQIFYSMQHIFGNENSSISYMDDNTFVELFDLISNMLIFYGKDIVMELIYKIKSTYSLKALLEQKDIIKKFFKNNLCSYNLIELKDSINLISKLEMQKYIKLKKVFSTMEETKAIHDELTSIYNLKKEEIISDKWQKEKKNWTKYCFEDDQYMIKAPDSPGEIAEEGIELRHCVRMYIERVADGETIILFLRKKEKTEIPYFTIEVDLKNHIKQIKGFCNKSLNEEIKKEENIINFIKKWSKQKELKFLESI